MNQLNRETLRQLRIELDAAVATIAAKHNLKIAFGSARFTPQNASFKVEIATMGDGGVAETQEVLDFRKYAAYLGFKPEDLGRVTVVMGVEYKIVGCRPKCGRNKIIATRVSDGQQFKLPTDLVLTGLGGAK